MRLRMPRLRRHALAALIAPALLVACSATHLKTSWRDPGVRDIHFQKIVAFVVAKDEALRRNGEHELCEQVKGTPCVPAFSIVPDDEVSDVAKVKRRVNDGSFDGAVLMRLVGRRVQQTYVPPATPMWGYYGGAWPMAYDPGYMRQDELVDVETRIYSVNEEKLVWAGTTESTNPRDVRKTVKEIADAVAKQLREEGLIPPKP
jgi:hypothetical protein